MNRNANIGHNVEVLFKNSVGDHPRVIKAIQSHFGIQSRFLTAIGTGIHSEKADVKMEFAGGNNVDVNVKAFKQSSASYNQLTRSSLENFCRKFSGMNLSELQGLVVAKAKDVNGHLFPADVRDRLLPVFQKIAKDILVWSFSHKQSREILAIYERDTSTMRIYPMKAVLEKIGTAVSFTRDGNIGIGSCVVIQRKGGNGVHSKHIPKDSLKHPGNDIQIKLKMKEVVREMESVLLVTYAV